MSARIKMTIMSDLSQAITQVHRQTGICKLARNSKPITATSANIGHITANSFVKEGVGHVCINRRRQDIFDRAVQEMDRDLTVVHRNVAIQIGD